MTREEEYDQMFINRLVDWITVKCSLPFKLAIEALPPIIAHRGMLYYDISDRSKIKKNYLVRGSEISSKGLNNVVQLPEQIYSVSRVFKMRGGSVGKASDFATERLFLQNSYSFGAFGGGDGQNSLVHGVINMYEYSMLQQTHRHPISYDYNRHSSELYLLGEYSGGDLVLVVRERIKLWQLYNDPDFFNWVVAEIYQQLGFIYETFDLTYIGGVKPNFSMWMEKGEKMEEKVEENHEKRRTNSIIMTLGSA